MRAEQMPAYRSISHTGSVIPLQTPSSSGSSFDRIYVRVCEDRWVIPFPPFCDARSIEDGVLEADVDYVQGDQWRPMFQALRNSNTKFRSISLRVGQTNASVFVTSTHNTQHSRRVAPVQARQCRLERNVKPLEPSQSVHLCCALAVTLTERSCYLKTFVLEGVLLNGQCVENLARGLTHCVSLEHVSFKDSLLGDAGAKNLVRVFRRCCWRLRSICLSGCDLTDASTTCICGLMYSREINLDGQRWQYSLRQCVRENDSVRNEYPETVNHWDLSNNYLTDLFLKKMEHVLGENMTITSLIVSCNCFTAGAIHAFLQRGVSLNRHLSYCDLSRNPGSSAACTEVFSMNDASFSVLSPCPGTLLMYRSLVRPRIQPQTADCAQERKQLKGEKRGETKRNFILNSVQTQNTLYNSDLDSESSSGALPITAQELMQESNPGPSDIYECFDTELNQMNLGALDKKLHNELSVMPLPSRGGKESSDSDTSYTANPDVRVLEKGMARELHTRTSIKRVAKKGKRCTQKKLETRILAKVVQENTRVIQQLHQGLLQISKKHQECDNPSEIDRETCFQLPSSLMLHIQRLSKTAHERAARAPNDSLLFDSSQNASDTMMNEVGRDAPDASNSRPFEPQSEFASQEAVTERCYRGGAQEEVEEMKYIVARQENLIHHLVHAVDMLQKEMNQRNQPRGGSLLQQKQDHQDGSRSNLTCISKYEPSNIFHSNNQQRLEGDVSSGESNEHESPVTPLSIRDSSPSARRDTDEEEHVRAMESHLLQLEYEANVANGLPRLDVPASDSGMIEKIKQRLIRQGWSV